MLSHGADPTVQNSSGKTVLHVTAPAQWCIQAILEDGRCDVNARNVNGMMALHRLCNEHSANVRFDRCLFLLLKNGAMINTSREHMSKAFRRCLKIIPEYAPEFRLILLASAGARLNVVFKSNDDREKLILRPLLRDNFSPSLKALRPLLPPVRMSDKRMKKVVKTTEEREYIAELFSSPISLQERCLQVVRMECRPNALVAAKHLPLPQMIRATISPFIECDAFHEALSASEQFTGALYVAYLELFDKIDMAMEGVSPR